MKTCIFIVGDKNSGKTSLIRSLTGVGIKKGRLWEVRKLNRKLINAFVILSAITELGVKKHNHTPNNFPDSLETQFGVERKDYELLICPFELRTYNKYSLDKYIEIATSKGFNVKVAIIKFNRKDEDYSIKDIIHICEQNKIDFIEIDIRKDYNPEANKIINRFYP